MENRGACFVATTTDSLNRTQSLQINLPLVIFRSDDPPARKGETLRHSQKFSNFSRNEI